MAGVVEQFVEVLVDVEAGEQAAQFQDANDDAVVGDAGEVELSQARVLETGGPAWS